MKIDGKGDCVGGGRGGVVLSAGVEGEMVGHCVRGYPREVCGFLIGRLGAPAVVTEVRAVDNGWENEDERGRRFAIHPREQMLLERELVGRGAGGVELVGFYHSHPDCEAQPSEYDLLRAWGVYYYVIVGVRAGEGEVRCWRLRDWGDGGVGRFVEIVVERGRGIA